MRLVNDEARSYLTRTDERFDILQMSLVDTWAATGAGAFTLSENALYTLEAWSVFLDRLRPGGVFSTSRWFSPQNLSETSRLVSLGVAALLDRGVEQPAGHIALVARGRVATLLVTKQPFSTPDLNRILDVCERYRFAPLVFPGVEPPDPQLAAIIASTSRAELEQAVAHPMFDFSPPTDDRPYFFNMLRLARFNDAIEAPRAAESSLRGGVIWGNIRATATLMILLIIAALLVVAIIFVPLEVSGLPDMRRGAFLLAVTYFAAIGYGFMSIQIPFLQRFSVLIGHPIYTYSVILFTMILFTGIASFISDRVSFARRPWYAIVPLAIAATLLVLVLAIGPILDATVRFGLVAPSLVVIVLTAPLSVLLGFCFPFGMRLVEAISEEATPWMWGVNGACGVLASILAVVVSIGMGIHINLWIAVILYALLLFRRSASPGIAGSGDDRRFESRWPVALTPAPAASSLWSPAKSRTPVLPPRVSF